MKDFKRVLQLVLQRRLTLAGCLFTAIVVALLWGLNIATLYPIVEVVFKGDGIPQYIQSEITSNQEEIERCDQSIAGFQQQRKVTNDPALRESLLSKIRFAETQRNAYQKLKSGLQRLAPYADQYAPQTPFGTLALVLFLLLAGTFVKLLTLTGNLMLVQSLAMRTANDVRALFFRKALHLDLDEFGDSGAAGLASRLTNDIGYLNGGITVMLGRMVREPLKMIVCVASAAFICWRLLLFVMIVMPLFVFVMHTLSRSIRRASRRVMDEMSQLYGMLNDAFAGIRVIKAYNTQAYERGRFGRSIHAYYRKSMKMAFYSTLTRSTSELMGMGLVSLAILAGGYLVIMKQTRLLGIPMTTTPLGTGEMLLFYAFLIGASDPARKLTDVWSSLQSGIAAASRVYEVIDRPVRVREPESPQTIAKPHKSIDFCNVHFQYPSGPPVLRGVDFTLRHGQSLAVVGPNGSGKSTLVSLLCRFDDPQRGSIEFDGVPLTKIRIRDLRRRIGLVTQRTSLFDDSILNNIRYGLPRVTRADVIAAAKQAKADEFICNKTPDGYDTVLGAVGLRLSGGQMQRIALARAFLRNPDILILDEATSQIDTESEQLIHEALREFLGSRTGLMITHRPTTLQLVDRIAVMDAGRLSDIGTHAELLDRNAFYRTLCGDHELPNAA